MSGSRSSPYSSASPLEREVLMNNLNVYKSGGHAGERHLADIKQQLLAEEPRKKSANQVTPLVSLPQREKSLIEGYSANSRKGNLSSEEPRRKDSGTTEADKYRPSARSGSPRLSSESNRSVDKQTSDDYDLSRSSRTSSYTKDERKSSVSNYGRKSSQYSERKNELDGHEDRRASLLSERHIPRKESPLLTDTTSFKMDSLRGRLGEQTEMRQSASLSRLYGSADVPSRDPMRPPALGALRDLESTRSQYSDYLGSRSHLDSDVSSVGHRSPSLKEKLSVRSDELLEEGEEEEMRPVAKDTKKKKKRKNPVSANLSGTRYDIVRQMAEQAGFTVSRNDDPMAYLIWNDSFVSTDRISELKPFQRINHFPGMGEICRKDCLARNMTKMAKAHPEEYSFVPKTWILPSEFSAFQTHARDLKKRKKSKTFISKPSNGAMGNGISLLRNPEKIPQNENVIVQEYIDKPLLVEGFKCDMRIYVLITSCDPLRVFLYNDGLLRLGTEKYVYPTDGNIDHLFMHLTNYSVNKHNDQYEKSHTVDTGSKRSLKYFNDYLRRNDYDVSFLWKSITELIVKTLIVALPHIMHAYRMCRPGQSPSSDSVCFELLGFDVMLDKKLRPWLIEINRSPSFGTDEKLDYDIKSNLVEHTLKLLNIKASDKRKNIAAQKAQTQRRLLRPNKRIDKDMSELDKKRQSVERKKEELKDLLVRIRKDASREDFENRHSGNFKRIFPPDDKFRRERYSTLITDAFNLFLAGRAASLHQEIQRAYCNKYKEEDILDMLAQCEADERDGFAITTNRPPRGPKPLQSMPTLSRDNMDQEDEEEAEDQPSPSSSPSSLRKGQRSRSSNSWGSRSDSRRLGSASVPNSRSHSLNRTLNVRPVATEETLTAASQRDKEDEMTRHTLIALNDMRIKFPGKSDDEADYILDKLNENWKFHKPRIASYWLVKLDSIKRRKVIDIVRSNVRALLQRTWRKCVDIDTLHLYRIFTRVFNRLLWSHGQGLWNCFQTSGNAWETIFSKSSETISGSEMACCRRVVQLCRDCLLIVYQFAAEAKSSGHQDAYDASSAHLIRNEPLDDMWTPSNALPRYVSRTLHR